VHSRISLSFKKIEKIAAVATQRLRLSLFVCSVVVSALSAAEISNPALPAHPMRIDSTKVEKTTSLSHDTVFFHLRCFWNGNPGEYWYYRDSIQNAVVAEFFNAGIRDCETAFPPGSPFKKLYGSTQPSKLALAGSEGRVIITLDKGKDAANRWSVMVDSVGVKGFRVTVGKKITGYRTMEKKTAHLPVIIAAMSLSLLCIVAGLVFLLDFTHA
jgi:hypothetical protein